MNEEQHTKQSLFSNQPVFWQVAILLVLLIGMFSTAIVHELSKIAHEDTAVPTTQVVNDDTQPAAETKQSATTLTDIEIEAQAALVWDVSNQKALYSKNENEVLPLASVTKLMTSLLAYELLPEGSDVRIATSDIRQSGDSGLLQGEYFSHSDLSDLVLMTSSNDGAHALARTGADAMDLESSSAFVTAMNIRAEQLGLSSLQFLNPTGLDVTPTIPGAVGSAYDVAKLTEYIVTKNSDLLQATTETESYIYNQAGAYHHARNTNSTVADIPGLIGSKTGYTDLAGGNLVVALESGLDREIVVVVLGSTRTGRFEDVLTLIDATKEVIIQ